MGEIQLKLTCNKQYEFNFQFNNTSEKEMEKLSVKQYVNFL